MATEGVIPSFVRIVSALSFRDVSILAYTGDVFAIVIHLPFRNSISLIACKCKQNQTESHDGDENMEITGNNLQQLRCCDPETGSENHPGRGSTFFQEKHACTDNTVPERKSN